LAPSKPTVSTTSVSPPSARSNRPSSSRRRRPCRCVRSVEIEMAGVAIVSKFMTISTRPCRMSMAWSHPCRRHPDPVAPAGRVLVLLPFGRANRRRDRRGNVAGGTWTAVEGELPVAADVVRIERRAGACRGHVVR
jgi:hypothetical protein